MQKVFFLGILISLILTGCSTPREQCISRSFSEHHEVLSSREVVQSNVSRGYAVHSQQIPYQYIGQCQDEFLNYYQCQKTAYHNKETPVAIDIEREEKNLESIDQRLSILRNQADVRATDCRRIHPE